MAWAHSVVAAYVLASSSTLAPQAGDLTGYWTILVGPVSCQTRLRDRRAALYAAVHRWFSSGSLSVCGPPVAVTRRGSRRDCPARSSTAHLAVHHVLAEKGVSRPPPTRQALGATLGFPLPCRTLVAVGAACRATTSHAGGRRALTPDSPGARRRNATGMLPGGVTTRGAASLGRSRSLCPRPF